MPLDALFAVPGSILLASRWLSPRRRLDRSEPTAGTWPRVSIIVPARNEVRTLPHLLTSLFELDYPDFEVIVVDDRSTDATAALVEAYPLARLVKGLERPAGWKGKQWACHQGRQAATGEVLLFTDADTIHGRTSLKRAVAYMAATHAGMISCLPYHDGEAWWEVLTGPFHVLLLTVTAPYGVPKPGRVYAIGQYLMFTSDAYDRIGGHAAVRAELVEDLPLANRCLKGGVKYAVYAGLEPLFRVRMYESLGAFVAGWRRNFRAGFGASSWTAPFEVTAMIAALTGAGHLGTGLGFSAALAAVVLVATIQRRLGRFSVLGALVFPLSIGLFCAITALTVADVVLRRPMVWKGRSYERS